MAKRRLLKKAASVLGISFLIVLLAILPLGIFAYFFAENFIGQKEAEFARQQNRSFVLASARACVALSEVKYDFRLLYYPDLGRETLIAAENIYRDFPEPDQARKLCRREFQLDYVEGCKALERADYDIDGLTRGGLTRDASFAAEHLFNHYKRPHLIIEACEYYFGTE